MMKNPMKRSTSLWSRALGTAAVAVLATPLFGGLPGGNGGEGSGGSMAGDLVGTLPVVAGPNDVFQEDWVLTGKVTFKPSLQLTGSVGVLEDAVLEASGEGYVWIPGIGPHGKQSQTYHGNISVLLDRGVIESGAVVSKLAIGAEFVGGYGILEWNGHYSSFRLGAGFLPLPLGTLSAGNLLDSGEIQLHLISPTRQYANVSIEAEGDELRIDQYVF